MVPSKYRVSRTVVPHTPDRQVAIYTCISKCTLVQLPNVYGWHHTDLCNDIYPRDYLSPVMLHKERQYRATPNIYMVRQINYRKNHELLDDHTNPTIGRQTKWQRNGDICLKFIHQIEHFDTTENCWFLQLQRMNISSPLTTVLTSQDCCHDLNLFEHLDTSKNYWFNSQASKNGTFHHL